MAIGKIINVMKNKEIKKAGKNKLDQSKWDITHDLYKYWRSQIICVFTV